MASILIVEDQPAVAAALGLLFDLHGLRASIARGPDEALRVLAAGNIAVVVQDMNFTAGQTGGEEGIELFRALRRRDPALPILLLTAWTSLETAITLVKEGAEDYLRKPWDDDRLVATVRALVERRERELQGARRRAGLERRREELAADNDLCGAVWASERSHQLIARTLQIARSDAPVLITGPSGAGKEKIAEILHRNSARARRPLVRVNAGALPEALLESELFGSEPGAFTGAAARLRAGRFEAADGGTLFLDEIGNLSAAGQMKLLRVLQRGEFERLGSSVTRRVDVRVLAATNADLEREIAAGRFREDLYYRLNVFELHVPALADRIEDVPALVEQFLAGLPPPPALAGWRLSPAAHELLLRQAWPGNVRELQNALRRATLVAEGGTIEVADLGLPEPSTVKPPAASPPPHPGPTESGLLPLAERIALERALEQAGGVVAQAAEALGLSRQALYRRLEKHGLSVERRVRGEH